MNKILITPKISPDLDGFACAYAYAKLLNKISDNPDTEYVCGIFGNFQPEVKFLIDQLGINDFQINPSCEFDKFIIVDASDIKGMPECIRKEDVTEVIDHRETNKAHDLFPNADIQIELIGAAATLILERFKRSSIDIDKDSGFLLFGAIHSNTLDLKVDITSDRDRESSRYLKEKFAIGDDFVNRMLEYKTDEIFRSLDKSIRDDFKVIETESGNLGIAQIEGLGILNLIWSNILAIKEILSGLKQEYGLKYIFLTSTDIGIENNILVATDADTEGVLAKKFDIGFNNGIAILEKMMLRKQMIPIILK